MRLALWVVAGLLFLCLIGTANAQQKCVCTTGCSIAANLPIAQGPNVASTCSAYLNGSSTATNTANVVSAASIPSSNAAVCFPASGNWNPGVAGDMACLVPIPAQAANTNVVVALTSTNIAGETGQSASYTFQSVAVLPVLSAPPTNLRVR